MDSPITTECDALREEIEMLAAENRRLKNLTTQLISDVWKLSMDNVAPLYPEAAVRAVWEHGRRVGEYEGGPRYNYATNAEEVSRIFTEALQKGE